jgi:periplasmic copper chaperone A
VPSHATSEPRRERRAARVRGRLVAVLALALLTLGAAACAGGGEPVLEVGSAQASEPVAGSAQLVLAVTNTGDADDTFLGATTPVALGVEIHRTEVLDGRATMTMLDEVVVPAGETVSFQPGGLHLMLVVPDASVRAGGTFEVTLRFARSGERTVPVRVVDLLDLVEGDEATEHADHHPAPEPEPEA